MEKLALPRAGLSLSDQMVAGYPSWEEIGWFSTEPANRLGFLLAEFRNLAQRPVDVAFYRRDDGEQL